MTDNTEKTAAALPEQANPEVKIISISMLDLDRLRIPDYQRPYKWGTKQVNQLLSDLLFFQESSDYRLGTLVLHKNTLGGSSKEEHLDIVDGQQRLLTIAVLLSKLLKAAQSAAGKEAEQKPKALTQEQKDFSDKLDEFCKNLKFSDDISIYNLKRNATVIESRLSDFKHSNSLQGALDFILYRCRFVEIILCDLSEAFQFFDSQNARGKELLPHDLLKAFHLREIPEMNREDENRLRFWEKQPDTEMQRLFLQLYRIRRWIYEKPGRFFTSRDIDVFKGFSLTADSVLPCQSIFLMAASFIKRYNLDPSRLVDKNKLPFPHQLDQTIINGSLFFDLVEYCTKLQQEIKQELADNAIIQLLDNYEGRNRDGDRYARALFDTALLYYRSKFGFDRSQQTLHNKNIEKIFAWVYLLRYSRHTLQLAAVDNLAVKQDSFFVFMHQAYHPSELLYWNFEKPQITSAAATKGSTNKGIKDMLRELGYLNKAEQEANS